MVKSCGSDGVIKKAKIYKKEQYATDFKGLRAPCGDQKEGVWVVWRAENLNLWS